MNARYSDPDLRMGLSLVTAPANPPLFLADVKTHLRVTDSSEDMYILSLIEVARLRLDGRDGYLGRALITQTWDCALDYNFPPDCMAIEIPLAPLQSATITHVDTDGVTQTVSSAVYTVDTKASRGRILPAYNQTWPSCRDVINAVTIRGVFGYGATALSVPEPIKQALLLMIGNLYENREETTTLSLTVLPRSVDHLLAPYRIRRF